MSDRKKRNTRKDAGLGMTVLSALCFLIGITFTVLLVFIYLWCGKLAIEGMTVLDKLLGVSGTMLGATSCYLVAIMSLAMSGILWKHRHDGDADVTAEC